jgi:ankyrin repeat protein
MKKSIVYLGIALISFTTVSQASNLISISKIEAAKPDYSKSTPLSVAIYKGDMSFIKKLVEYGADVNEEKNRLTPLMIAARYNNVEVIQYLVSKGAKLDQKNDLGLTAASYAKLSNANDVVAYLSVKKTKCAGEKL